jgi:hypothetical protein
VGRSHFSTASGRRPPDISRKASCGHGLSSAAMEKLTGQGFACALHLYNGIFLAFVIALFSVSCAVGNPSSAARLGGVLVQITSKDPSRNVRKSRFPDRECA